ncbi:hypothetical protein NX059_007915 [Plenodomus lindquistii]|nr:hypothetical protein NX059_007915 [Plenodomus lindquistii]
MNKGYAAPPKDTVSYSPPSATASKSHSPPRPTTGSYPPAKHTGPPSSSVSKGVYGSAKSTSAGHHGPPTTVSKVYSAPSTSTAPKSYAPVKEHGHGASRVSSDKSAYSLPAPTGHGPPMRPSGKPEYVPEGDEEEEPDYAAPTPSKSKPQHPHSPPSTGPAYPPHTRPTQSSHKTTYGKPYPPPPVPTYGGDDEGFRVKRADRVALSAVMQRQAHPKACLSWYHDPSLPGIAKNDAEDILKARIELKGKKLVDVMNTNNTECPDKQPLMHDGKYSVCLKPLCTSLGGSCSDLKDDLETAAVAKFGRDIDYTTDEDVCG